LKRVIDPEEDFITIIKLLSKEGFDEETLGVNKRDGESLFV